MITKHRKYFGNKIHSSLYFLLGSVIWIILLPIATFGQKLNFTKYSLEEGILQSQVSAIAQDPFNHLWIATMAGANRFDGKNFRSFTSDQGIRDIGLSAVSVDRDGIAWFGNSSGLIRIEGGKVTNYAFETSESYGWIKQIVFSGEKLWALSHGKLYFLDSGKLKRLKISNQPGYITHIETDNMGRLYIAIQDVGILRLDRNTWKMHLPLTQELYIAKFGFDPNDNKKIFFTSKNRLFEGYRGKYVQVEKELLDGLPFKFSCITADGKGGYWLGASEGAAYLSAHKITIYNQANGYTNHHTSGIFRDAEGNIWFATNGDGLYKLSPNSFSLFDDSQGLPNSVTGIAKSRDNTLYFGTINDGLFKLEHNRISSIRIPSDNSDSKKINGVFMDSADNLFISTYYGGLWRYHNSKFENLLPLKNKEFSLSFGKAAAVDGKIWIPSTFGIFIYHNGQLNKLPNFFVDCSSILPLGDNRVIVVTANGVKMLTDGKLDHSFKMPPFQYVTTVHKLGDYLYLGTVNRGVIVYNLKNSTYRMISSKNGLYSNYIYILAIKDSQLWVGTGLGVNKFKIGKNPNELTLLPNWESITAESNLDAFLFDRGKIFLATSKGVIVQSSANSNSNYLRPFMAIQHVSVDKDVKTAYRAVNGYPLPEKLQLGHLQNNISFEFKAISLLNTRDVKYEFILKGLKDKVGITSNNLVTFSDLPPGNYTFLVDATFHRKFRTNVASFSFVVLPAFYQTRLFQIFILTIVILTIYALFRYKLAQRDRKTAQQEQLRVQVQESIRRQTAEDLHDDFGNKLTRINMISELLDRITPEDNLDMKALIKQIRFSAAEMYNGSRDLLWALNPKNDSLGAIIRQLKKNIQDTIRYTSIQFSDLSIDTDYTDQNLPLGYSRHITLISKEIATNLIKHSNANLMTFNIEMPEENQYVLTFVDDGQGCDLDAETDGHGIKNLQNRAAKLNGDIKFTSAKGRGMKIVLTFNLQK